MCMKTTQSKYVEKITKLDIIINSEMDNGFLKDNDDDTVENSPFIESL